MPGGRTRRWGLLIAVLVPAILAGGFVATLVGGYIFLIADQQRRDADDRAAADTDPRFQQPLVSTVGRILFVAQRDQTDDFYVVNVDGSGLTRLTHMPRGWHLSGIPVVSPDGTRLAITGGKGVSLVRLDRPGETTELVRAPVGSLAWSGDGTQLASLSIDMNKRLHLWVFDADSNGPTIEIAGAWPSTAAGYSQSADDLSWSPNGKWFAFTLYTNARAPYALSGPRYTHTYLAPIDGRAPRNLSLEPNPPPLYGPLVWSPDSRRLAGRNGEGIVVMDPDLKWKQIPIFAHRTNLPQRPAWSPDSRRLAWFNPDSIVISDSDGGEQQQLTRGRCRGTHPAWSDDGRRLAFTCDQPGAVFVMNADGSGLTSVHVGPKDEPFGGERYLPRYPVWLPAIAAAERSPSPAR